MVNRILLTSLAAICAAEPLFTPVAASARAGASGGGFHAGFRPSFHAAPPLTRAFPARIGDFRRPFVRDRRVGRVLVWPGSGSFDPYYYYPSDDAAPYEGATEGISAPQPRAPEAPGFPQTQPPPPPPLRRAPAWRARSCSPAKSARPMDRLRAAKDRGPCAPPARTAPGGCQAGRYSRSCA